MTVRNPGFTFKYTVTHRPFLIVPADQGPRAWLYTLHFEGRAEPELDRFLAREEGRACTLEERARCTCRHRCRRFESLSRLVENLDLSVNVAGFRPEFFRPLANYEPPSAAFSAGPFRLFGIRFGYRDDEEPGPTLLIAGDGGLKLTRRIYDDPSLAPRFEDVLYAARQLRDRLSAHGLDAPPIDGQGRLYLPDEFLQF